ncbi:hypothetical protein [Kitasatospora sp. NPDC093679]|uniref:hypothetical protein n=1 Tax=Kitasatospora sp. NPDC093679 TaxID=3154983 RepID=UPI00341DD1FA
MEQGQKRADQIAARLDGLIKAENDRRAAKGDQPLKYAEIAERINTRSGEKTISVDTVRNLHLGRGTGGRLPNPTVATLDALGLAFGIRDGAQYFLADTTEAVDRQLEAVHDLAALSSGDKAELVGLMTRAAALSPESVRLVVGLADRLRAIEAQHSTGQRNEAD